MLDLKPYFGNKKSIWRLFANHIHMDDRVGKRTRYAYVDNGAGVLLVAHIDTVQPPRLDDETTGAGFDDRVGVALGHYLVREYPDSFDLLLTDYEESGGSTARYFKPSHEYRIVVELDREGEDFVDYGLASEETIAEMEEWGFRWNWGSYTDICSMPQVKCDKVNIGVGVYHSHSPQSGYRPTEMWRQVARLLGWLGVDESQEPVHYPSGRGMEPEERQWEVYGEEGEDTWIADRLREQGWGEDQIEEELRGLGEYEWECGRDWPEDWPNVDDEEEDWLLDEYQCVYDPDDECEG